MIEVTKKFSKKIVVTIFVTVVAGFAAVIVCNCYGITIQDAAIIGYFGVMGGEFGLLAWIKTKDDKRPARGADN